MLPPQPDRQPPGRGRAERDELVHVAAAIAQGSPAGTVKARPQAELHGGGQGELHPGGPEVVVAPEHGQHQRHAGQGPQADRAPDRPPGGMLVGQGVVGLLHLGLVACGLDGGDQPGRIGHGAVRRRSQHDAGGFGGEIHLGLRHTRHFAQSALDPVDAGRARHAAHSQQQGGVIVAGNGRGRFGGVHGGGGQDAHGTSAVSTLTQWEGQAHAGP